MVEHIVSGGGVGVQEGVQGGGVALRASAAQPSACLQPAHVPHPMPSQISQQGPSGMKERTQLCLQALQPLTLRASATSSTSSLTRALPFRPALRSGTNSRSKYRWQGHLSRMICTWRGRQDMQLMSCN